MIEIVTQEIRKIAPVQGVSLGRLDDKSTWRIDFEANATKKERRDAQAYINSLDLGEVKTKADAQEALRESDKDMARMVEDLVDVLPDAMNNLPQQAKDKIMNRKTLRSRLK